MPMTHDEIVESMMETIAECEQAIKARPSSKRDFEMTLVSSGMRIVEVQDDQQALFWAS
jgi:hypothetical protein